MPDLPSGTVTFLFTDIEGSTERWERDKAAMAAAVARHLVLMRIAIEAHGGVLFKTVGDAVQAAFPVAPRALAAAMAAQRALQTESWSDPPGPLQVRMALHTGEAYPQEGDYLAAALNRLSRLLAAGHGGQVLLTQTVQHLVRADLPAGVTLRDLGTHRLRDLQEPEVVFQVLAQGLPDQFPPLRSLPSHPTNLTEPPTALLGRDEEVTRILGLLDGNVRLVTLTGPGGTGKTRLAQEIGAEALDRVPDGVFFVDLAPIREADLVVSAIASVLGVRESSLEPVRDTLVRFLADRTTLLVLDNCEQVLEAAKDIAALLGRCPQLAILATSREPLHIRAERTVPVAPLPIPDNQPGADLAQLAYVPSVALFVERAQAADPGFTLTQENAAGVATLCRQLDGLPLAIELAAARVSLLPPEALLTRLERRLPLLTGGARDLPDRQRTLRDTIAWSYELLSENEQALFRRLTVFVGGWAVEAAEAVATLKDDLDVLRGLGSLVDKSMVRRVEGLGGKPRFGMLETIREYGLERFTDSTEEESTRNAHAQYYLTRVETYQYELEGPRRATSQAAMRVELDNLRAALAWAMQRQDGVTAQGIAGGLGSFWLDYGLFSEGRHWLEQALTLPDPEAIAAPEAHYWAGALALYQGDLESAKHHGEAGLACSQAAGRRFGEGEALFLLGLEVNARGDMKSGEHYYEEALRIFTSLQDPPWALAMVGVVLDALGELARQQGNTVEAQRRFEESLAYWRSLDHPWGVPMALFKVAEGVLQAGDPVRALSLYTECLERHWVLHDTFHIAWDLQGFGEALLACGHAKAAAELLSSADQLIRSMGYTLFAGERAPVDAARDQAQSMLSEDEFSTAWNAGRALDVDTAVARARTLVTVKCPASSSTSP